MKRLAFSVLFSLTACSLSSQAQIADWTFETSAPVTAGPFSPEIGSGSATGSHAGTAVYSSPSGNGSTHSFSSTLWANGDYYQFQVNTVGFSSISVSYDQTSSNTGPGQYDFQYSTDGINFTTFVSKYTVLANAAPNTAWSPTTVNSAFTFSDNLGTVTALNNQATVYFRVTDDSTTSANGGTVGTGGTDRIDNFDVVGAATPEPQSLFLVSGFGLLAWNFLRRRK